MSQQTTIPYQLREHEKDLTAVFFRVLRSRKSPQSFVAGLLLIDARGEPLEFTYSKVEAGHRFLWRDSTLRAGAKRELAAALFDECPRVPTAIFALAGEVDPELFTEHLDVQRPLARVAREDEVIGVSAEETQQLVAGREPVQLLWVHGQPSEATDAATLVSALARRALLLEPFERVLAGLREVYAEEAADAAEGEELGR
jgi:hypothetical protein